MGDEPRPPTIVPEPGPEQLHETLATQLRALVARGFDGRVEASGGPALERLVGAVNELVAAARASEIRSRAIARDRDELDATMAEMEGRLAREITSHERTVRELRQQRSLLRSVLDAFPYCIFWKDREGVYLGANENKLRALGLRSVDELIGKTDYELSISSEAAESFRNVDRRVMDSGEPVLNLKETQIRPDGRHVLLTTKVPLRDDSGSVTGILGMYIDVTGTRTDDPAEEWPRS